MQMGFIKQPWEREKEPSRPRLIKKRERLDPLAQRPRLKRRRPVHDKPVPADATFLDVIASVVYAGQVRRQRPDFAEKLERRSWKELGRYLTHEAQRYERDDD
jgi:hypothetical protein